MEHIGIVARPRACYCLLFTLLNTLCYKREEVESQQVTTAFFNLNQKLNPLAATSEESPIAKFIQCSSEGIHT